MAPGEEEEEDTAEDKKLMNEKVFKKSSKTAGGDGRLTCNNKSTDLEEADGTTRGSALGGLQYEGWCPPHLVVQTVDQACNDCVTVGILLPSGVAQRGLNCGRGVVVDCGMSIEFQAKFPKIFISTEAVHRDWMAEGNKRGNMTHKDIEDIFSKKKEIDKWVDSHYDPDEAFNMTCKIKLPIRCEETFRNLTTIGCTNGGRMMYFELVAANKRNRTQKVGGSNFRIHNLAEEGQDGYNTTG